MNSIEKPKRFAPVFAPSFDPPLILAFYLFELGCNNSRNSPVSRQQSCMEAGRKSRFVYRSGMRAMHDRFGRRA